MDFTKFVALLADQALFFARADLLGDPFEGSTTKVNKEFLRSFYKHPQRGENLEGIHQTLAQFSLKNTAVSCWHMNEHESAAMWKLYLKMEEGIAIRSTFARLERSFQPDDGVPKNMEHTIFAGEVRYLDYDTDSMDMTSSYAPFMHKKVSFNHEREVRAVISCLPMQGLPITSGTSLDSLACSFPNGGVSVSVDLQTLVERVYIAPRVKPWFVKLVKSVIQTYGFAFPVQQSRLGEDPIY